MVGECHHVVDLVDDTPAGTTRRPAVPGPVVGYEEDAEAAIELLVRPSLESAARRSVQREDREAVGVTPQRVRKLASIGCLERQEGLAHGRGAYAYSTPMTPRLVAMLGVGVLALGGASSGPAARQALEWRQAAPLPVPRSEVAAATVGKELVIAGGFLADGRSSKRVDAYSPGKNRWRRLPDLPVAVNHAMAASDGKKLYVLGGYGAPTRAFVLSKGRWRRLPNLPAPRAAAGAAIVGRTLYVIGGVANGGLARRGLAFDRVRRRWSLIPGPKPREHLGVSALGNRVYAVAGREAGVNFDALQAYDTKRRRWVTLPPVPETRGGTDSAAVGSLLISAGSESSAGTSAERCTRTTSAAGPGRGCPTCRRRGTGSASSHSAAAST